VDLVKKIELTKLEIPDKNERGDPISDESKKLLAKMLAIKEEDRFNW